MSQSDISETGEKTEKVAVIPGPKAPLIKLAPTAAQKRDAKAFRKRVESLGGETTREVLVPATPEAPAHVAKVLISRRNEDYFSGGPLDGHTCKHCPNGPDQPWDKGRYWADYYFKDTMRLAFVERAIPGYHIYSSSRALMMVDSGQIRHRDHVKGHQLNLGTRGAQMRKMYYYIGFMETHLLQLDGIIPEMFTGILSIS